MKIAIRVDASPAMGTGHVRRCLSLALALRKLGADVRFVTRQLGLDSPAMIAEQGFTDTILLQPPRRGFAFDTAVPHFAWALVPWDQDARETTDALREFAPDWMVLDSYAFDARWHEHVSDALGCKLAAIDDLADRALDCDIVIDHTWNADHRAKYAPVLQGSSRILGGPRFGLLGPAYAEARRYTFHKDVRSIGIFMGGVDPGNHSAVVLDALQITGFDGPVEVVATSANPYLADLREAVAARPDTKLALDLPDLATFFARHDIQVGSGGGASWERCCIGVPMLLTVIASNQNSVAPLLARKGIAAYAPDPDPQTLAHELTALIADATRRRALADASRRLVDGGGARRVAMALLAQSLKVRPARLNDAQMMFDWRDHSATRAVSGTHDPLVWEEHIAWLERVLADPARPLYIGEIGGSPVGVIRFDFAPQRADDEAARAEVSLYCDPALHGLGLGPALLLAGEVAANPAIVDATVLAGNHASRALFEKCGYAASGPTAFVKHRLSNPDLTL